jgi:hypothetical protein
MAQVSKEANYEDAALSVLAYEFPFTDKRESETKIKRKLRAKKLGKYEQERIDLLRRFKDEVQAEISQWQKSKYYTHSHGEFADMKDYDRERMAKDFAAAYHSIPERSIAQFIDFAVYLYYLR